MLWDHIIKANVKKKEYKIVITSVMMCGVEKWPRGDSELDQAECRKSECVFLLMCVVDNC